MTTYSLNWLADVLRAAGLDVHEEDGWKHRSVHGSDMGKVLGVLCHHTAGPAGVADMPSLGVCEHGRPDLCGPLCQLCLGRSGKWYVVSAGRANHAGRGNWKGVTTGNSSFIGIEAENHGCKGDAWPPVQIESYAKGVAAILKHIGRDENWCVGHKEYALPKGRKTDPTFDMNIFRSKIKQYMSKEQA